MNKNQYLKRKLISSFKKNLILGCLVLCFLVTNIYLVLSNVNSGSKLAELEKKESEILKINSEITSKLVNSTSLLSLQKESLNLGYSKHDDHVYIKESVSVASRF